ncbi:hypothetical protein VTH06DRAFT_6116 [Thermothelomyces fergusii]
MPRFSVAFGRRKSASDNLENATLTGSSFRVLERTEVVGTKPFDGGAKLTTATHALHRPTGSDVTIDNNIFADFKPNRGSGSSNTTKTASTDNSSRHSNASTAPSSADTGGSDEWRGARGKPAVDVPVPPIPKPPSAGFLKAAGRTFSFGGQKKPSPTPPTIEESPPSTPAASGVPTAANGRPRAPTSSTSTTATVTPPRLDNDFDLDLGGDFGKLVLDNEKRASVATMRNEQYSGQVPPPRSLTAARPIQPSPLQMDMTAKVEPPAHSWSSQHSNDQLIACTSPPMSPATKNDAPRNTSPQPERQESGHSPEVGPGRPLLAPQRSDSVEEDAEDEEAKLLKDSLSTVTKFIAGTGNPESAPDDGYSGGGNGLERNGDGLFDTRPGHSSQYQGRYSGAWSQSGLSGGHKIMTPAEFERYRKDKERQDRERELLRAPGAKAGEDEDEDENYEDDEDDAEKARQQAKQRRKQEAHMSVYRQQMMKVTGESASSTPPSKPGLQMSFSTPNLPNSASAPGPAAANTSENSDEDEDIPLAILAAHGFPAKNRPPNRLSSMGSNPNLRASQQPSYQRPTSLVGDAQGSGNSRLPAFARNLPKDPFVGASLVRNPVRESFALGGGSSVPPGGLIGVIATEERNRAMRRGSPHLDGPGLIAGTPGFDPIAGIPAHMTYQANPARNSQMLSPGDQAQIQMTQQMQQFMQMQMQFMQMMANQSGNAPSISGGGPLTSSSTGNLTAMGGGLTPGFRGPDARHSFVGNEPVLDLPFGRGETQMRTMSMVQPSSASWIQPTQPVGYAPSSRGQSGGYTPSIAPSERSNIGLPGRYRPVSHVPVAPAASHLRKSSAMSGAVPQPNMAAPKSGSVSDDDDEEGWEAMKAKREKKKSLWRAKKSVGDGIGALIS